MPGKRILIVDDDVHFLDNLVAKLRQAGFEVMAFSNGEEVVKKCKIFNPDLVLLDIVMPGVDGYSIAQALRQERALEAIPIIFITAQELEYPAITKRVEEIGRCGFILKHRPFEELLARIQERIG